MSPRAFHEPGIWHHWSSIVWKVGVPWQHCSSHCAQEDLQSTKRCALAGIWGPQVIPELCCTPRRAKTGPRWEQDLCTWVCLVGDMNQHEAVSSPNFAGAGWCAHPAALPTQPFTYLLNICWVERTDCPTMPPSPQVSWTTSWSLFPLCTAKKQHRAQNPTQMLSKTARLSRAVRPVTETRRSHCYPSWPSGRAWPDDNLRPDFKFSTSLSETSLQNHISCLFFFQFIKPAWCQKPFTSLQYGTSAHENNLLHCTKLGGTEGQVSSACQGSKAFEHT